MLEVLLRSTGGSCFLPENQEVTVSNGDEAVKVYGVWTTHTVDLVLDASVLESELLTEEDSGREVFPRPVFEASIIGFHVQAELNWAVRHRKKERKKEG